MSEMIDVIAIVLSAGALLALYMVFVEPRRFRIRRLHVPLDPDGKAGIGNPGLPDLRILHVTDTHFCGRDGAKLAFLRRVAQEPYDIVLLTGDLIDTPAGVEGCAEAARILASAGADWQQENPPAGVYAVLGGHDYYHPALLRRYAGMLRSHDKKRRKPYPPNPADELIARLEETGATVLRDESRLLETRGGAVALVGLNDSFCFDVDYDAAWRDVPPDVPLIAMAHSPDVLPEVVRRGADLAFFGHTHGGQVRLPLIGALVTRSELSPRRASGVFREGRTVFTINNGVGAGVGIAFRLLCRPEVSVVTVGSPVTEAGA